MTATTTAPEIAAFAASVRRHLDDLPADDVDDLVDGLEADLLEQAAESEGFEIPDAATYAAELRAAAGLPERAETPAPGPTVRERVIASGAGMLRRIRANRAGAWTIDLLVALRPVWWLLRGWVLYFGLGIVTGIGTLLPASAAAVVLFAAMMLLSIQWGRGRWLPFAWLRVVRVIIDIAAVIFVPVLLAALMSYMSGPSGGVEYVDTSQPGLTIDGERIRNIFVYDADGTPLTDVQLFDQSGRPLTTVGDAGGTTPVDDYFLYGGGPVPVALSVPGRAPIWNVYPLAELPADAPVDDTGNPDTSKATTPIFPFPFVPAVPVTAADAATPAVTPAATPEPTPAVTP